MSGIGTAVEPFEWLFTLAYFFLFLSVLWAIGWWLFSDALEKKKPKLTKKQKKHKVKISTVPYQTWKWGGVFVVLIAFMGSLQITSEIRLARQLSLNHGWLVPASEPTPSNSCDGAPSNALKILLGSNTAYATRFPSKVISVNEDTILTLDKDAKGNVAATVDVFDQNNDIVVEIDKNHFRVANDTFNVVHNDLSSLEVVIKHNKEHVLGIHYLNPSAIQIVGVFRHPGDPQLAVTAHSIIFDNQVLDFDRNCSGDNGGAAFHFVSRRVAQL